MQYFTLPLYFIGHFVASQFLVIMAQETTHHRQQMDQFDGGLTGDVIVRLRGNSYNISAFVPNHPGGAEVLRAVNGQDVEDYLEGRKCALGLCHRHQHAYQVLSHFELPSDVIVRVRDKFYNITAFVPNHPGGPLVLRAVNGQEVADYLEGRKCVLGICHQHQHAYEVLSQLELSGDFHGAQPHQLQEEHSPLAIQPNHKTNNSKNSKSKQQKQPKQLRPNQQEEEFSTDDAQLHMPHNQSVETSGGTVEEIPSKSVPTTQAKSDINNNNSKQKQSKKLKNQQQKSEPKQQMSNISDNIRNQQQKQEAGRFVGRRPENFVVAPLAISNAPTQQHQQQSLATKQQQQRQQQVREQQHQQQTQQRHRKQLTKQAQRQHRQLWGAPQLPVAGGKLARLPLRSPRFGQQQQQQQPLLVGASPRRSRCLFVKRSGEFPFNYECA